MKKQGKKTVQQNADDTMKDVEMAEVALSEKETIDTDDIEKSFGQTPEDIETESVGDNINDILSEIEAHEGENLTESKKYKIKAIKRALDAKQSSLEREQAKNLDWRKQAAIRDEKATTEYDKRKAEVEEQLKKIEERYQKRIARTKKWWHEYADNHEANKIKRLLGDIETLQSELTKIEGGTEEATAIQN